AFRSTSLGIMLAVVFVLAAALTLLPAVLGKLGPRVDRFALPRRRSDEQRPARFAAWAERLWRRPLAYGAIALAVPSVLAFPGTRVRRGRRSIKVVPASDPWRVGYRQVRAGRGRGAPGPLQIVAPADEAADVARIARRDRGVATLLPARASNGYVVVTAIPR